MDNLLLTNYFIPTGQVYGVAVTDARVTVTDILANTVNTASLLESTVTGGVSYMGVQYNTTFNVSTVAGPYVNVLWESLNASGVVELTNSYKAPLIRNNSIVTIEFLEDLKDVSGNILVREGESVSYTNLLVPFYTPIDLFRQKTYGLFESETDLEVAMEIWHASVEADHESFCAYADLSDPASPRVQYLSHAKEEYTHLIPLINRIVYITTVEGSVTKQLADFMITLERGRGISSSDALKSLLEDLKHWKKVLNSCGEVSHGASLKPQSGRIADAYDRTVFGRYIAGRLGYFTYYLDPPAKNHLFTDPFSAMRPELRSFPGAIAMRPELQKHPEYTQYLDQPYRYY